MRRKKADAETATTVATDSNDIVSDILDRIALLGGVTTPDKARKLEQAVRRDYGGNAHYIAKRGETYQLELLERNLRIRAEHRRGEHVPLLARRYGLSEMRVRQILADAKPKNALP